MIQRVSTVLRLFAFVCLAVGAFVTCVLAQTPSGSKNQPAAKAAVSRTANGQPDLQGIWSFATITPLERPPELEGKEFFASDKEAADYETEVRRRNNMDRRDGPAEHA